MVQLFLPSCASYHKPPCTDEEVRDPNRRVSGIVAFTRPGGRRAAAAQELGEEIPEVGGYGAQASSGDPSVNPAPS
jgi:hypothetical protein